MRKAPIDIKKLLSIDFSDLASDLAETLLQYGYYGEQAAKAWGKSRRARQVREGIAGSLYFISKEDVLENGRQPSDKYIEMEFTQDEDWLTAQEEYHNNKLLGERMQSLVRALEYKLDSLRTLMANERLDKQHHLKDN